MALAARDAPDLDGCRSRQQHAALLLAGTPVAMVQPVLWRELHRFVGVRVARRDLAVRRSGGRVGVGGPLPVLATSEGSRLSKGPDSWPMGDSTVRPTAQGMAAGRASPDPGAPFWPAGEAPDFEGVKPRRHEDGTVPGRRRPGTVPSQNVIVRSAPAAWSWRNVVAPTMPSQRDA